MNSLIENLKKEISKMKRKSLLALMVAGLFAALITLSANAAEPLMIKDLEDMHITTIRSSITNGYAFTAGFVDDISYTFGNVKDNSNIFTDGYQTQPGPDVTEPYWKEDSAVAKLQVYLTVEEVEETPQVQAGDTVTITYDGGQTLLIYYPQITTGWFTQLWVDIDGSTYYDEALTQLAQAAPDLDWIDWTVMYEANELPTIASPPWTFSVGSEGVTLSVENGILTVDGYDGDEFWKRRNILSANNVGNIVEISLKTISQHPTGGAAMLGMRDGEKGTRAAFFLDKVQFYGSVDYYLDTSDAFHIYRVELKGSVVNVFIDGVYKGSPTPMGEVEENHIYFGIPSSGAKCQIDYVRYYTGGIPAQLTVPAKPTAPTNLWTPSPTDDTTPTFTWDNAGEEFSWKVEARSTETWDEYGTTVDTPPPVCSYNKVESGSTYWYECNGVRVTQVAETGGVDPTRIYDFRVVGDVAIWAYDEDARQVGGETYYINSVYEGFLDRQFTQSTHSGPEPTGIRNFQIVGELAIWLYDDAAVYLGGEAYYFNSIYNWNYQTLKRITQRTQSGPDPSTIRDFQVGLGGRSYRATWEYDTKAAYTGGEAYYYLCLPKDYQAMVQITQTAESGPEPEYISNFQVTDDTATWDLYELYGGYTSHSKILDSCGFQVQRTATLIGSAFGSGIAYSHQDYTGTYNITLTPQHGGTISDITSTIRDNSNVVTTTKTGTLSGTVTGILTTPLTYRLQVKYEDSALSPPLDVEVAGIPEGSGGSTSYTLTSPLTSGDGTYYWRVGANDGTKDGPWSEVKSFILETNKPPVLNPVGNKTVNEGQLLEFTVTATDPNNDPLIFSANNLPQGASFNSATQVFSWTPDYTQSGVYPNVHFEVSDGKLSDSENITITVNEITQPPLVTITTPEQGEEVSDRVPIRAEISDPNGDPLTVSVYIDGTLVRTLQITEGTDVPQVYQVYLWKTYPDYPDGAYTITVKVNDGFATVSDSVGVILANAVNVAGTVYGFPPKRPLVGASIQLFQNGDLKYETSSDASGYYHFDNIVPGMYLRVASKEGYRTSERRRNYRPGQDYLNENIMLLKKPGRP